MDYNYLDLLNPQQRSAVLYNEGPSLVIAGAGSGKTRVLTYKIVDLLAHGYEPYRIMALTFTNKAAREMKDRIADVVGERIASKLWMGTFHSIFLRILRRHPQVVGYEPGFTIYDASDSRSLIKMIIRDRGLDDKVYKPATVAAIISNAKNALITADRYSADPQNYTEDKRAGRPAIGEIYKIYEERCRLANAMDFDDILLNMNLLLRDNPDLRRHYQEFFRYILVDEYQDTNFAQHLAISQLSGPEQRVCVVGDDAQSIYSFRGANIDNILTLTDRYPRLKIFKLERNYRSTQNIIDAAGSLIEKNRRQMPKKVYSENPKGKPLDIIRTYSDIEEAAIVAARLQQSRLTAHDSYDDYAILYRVNAQSRPLEQKLRQLGIPYRIYGGIAFYQRKEIKDAVSYFRAAVNPDDDEALRRILNYPARGIGKVTEDKIIAAALRDGCSLWHVINHPEAHSLQINKGTATKLQGFATLISEFHEFQKDNDALQTSQLIYRRAGLISQFSNADTPEDVSARENLNELTAGIKEFVDERLTRDNEESRMYDFLSEISLATDMDQADDENQPKVTLMTAHASKGLEFNHIYIVGVEEELFPASLSMGNMAAIEEERRLLYVAITRARHTCTLTYAGSRFRNGQTTLTLPSRFLKDIDPQYTNKQSTSDFNEPWQNYTDTPWCAPAPSRSNFSMRGRKPAAPTPRSSFSSQPIEPPKPGLKKLKLNEAKDLSKEPSRPGTHTHEELKVGTRISHDKFGKGTVTDIQTQGDPSISVTFDDDSNRRLLLRFARFQILE